VVDGAGPREREVLHRTPLRVADRRQRHVVEVREQRPQVRQVEPAVERVQGRRRHQAREREREVVHVAVNEVELLRPIERLGELHDVGRERIGDSVVEPDRPRHRRYQ
jgi:hypothetical protein